MTLKQLAISNFRQVPERLNCAQTVLHAYQTVTGRHVAALVDFKPFGGGRAPLGECGALYAACQAIPESAEDFRETFATRTGATLCSLLSSTPCTDCVALAAELLQQKLAACGETAKKHISTAMQQEVS